MYYLSCVFITIQYDNYNKLSDYQNYTNLNEEEKNLVYALAILFNPKIFISAGVFMIKPELLSENRANDFLKITDKRIGVHVSDEIMIGGRVVKVLQIMVCKKIWLERNYYSPLKNIIPKDSNEIQYSNRNISGNDSNRNNFVPQSQKIIINQSKPKEKAFRFSNSLNNFDVCFSCGENGLLREKSFGCGNCCSCFCYSLFFFCFFPLSFILCCCVYDKIGCFNNVVICPNCGEKFSYLTIC